MNQKGYCSKESLKTLSKKEIQLKELLFQVILATKSTNKEVIRTLAYMINKFKNNKKVI